MLVKKKDRNDLQRVAKAKEDLFSFKSPWNIIEEGGYEMEEINKRMKKKKSFPYSRAFGLREDKVEIQQQQS
ncbi:hypothetical protein CEXT_245951 [Caerostris extrusa]|uniref:Uncharacterized protein n=1 Tax=Caerostris extrusa TaxID=172846 RepID=A0AAV4NW93_CAEEX|nr:hypothetical protein CEXT_245951 [Caerostris extrusa]